MRCCVRVCQVWEIPIDLQISWPPVFIFVSWTLAVRFFPAIDPSWPVVADWIVAIFSSSLLFASLLAHELGHAVVARQHGLRVFRISLFCLGGLAEIDVDGGTPADEFWMALAGPVVSGLLAVGCSGAGLVISALHPSFGAALLYLGISNLLLALFNLVPGYPLDGGRLLRAGLWQVWSDRARATRWASWIGQAIGGSGAIAGLASLLAGEPFVGIWLVAVGAFLTFAARGTISSIFLPSP